MGQRALNNTATYSPPQDDEIEISLFGPGYGESILVHFGNNNWIIVDSCIDPINKKPAVLNYLLHLGIDYSNAVQLIAATHWHDDHIRGIGELVKKCERTEFLCSSAYNNDDFLELVEIYGARKSTDSNTGICDFISTFESLKSRKRPPIFAVANRMVWRKKLSGTVEIDCKIYSLSPSDAEIQKAIVAIGKLIPKDGDRQQRLPSPRPNHSAVVLLLNINDEVIALLGSDLEETLNKQTGWSVIVESASRPESKASVFKVPHHGSQNGHSQKVWEEMLEKEPCVILTPFSNAGIELPCEYDISRILSFSTESYITTRNYGKKTRESDPLVRNMISEHTKWMKQIEPQCGHIQLRKKIGDKDSSWTKKLFCGACKL
jgi:hypothetical protein